MLVKPLYRGEVVERNKYSFLDLIYYVIIYLIYLMECLSMYDKYTICIHRKQLSKYEVFFQRSIGAVGFQK